MFEKIPEYIFGSFAIPGVKAGQRNTSEKEFALEAKCEINPTDSLEAR